MRVKWSKTRDGEVIDAMEQILWDGDPVATVLAQEGTVKVEVHRKMGDIHTYEIISFFDSDEEAAEFEGDRDLLEGTVDAGN